MKLSEHIKAVIDALTPIVDRVDGLDDIEGKEKAAEASLKAIQDKIDGLGKEFENRKVQIREEEKKLRAEIDRVKNDRNAEVERSEKLFSSYRTKLSELEAEIKGKRAEHDAILASLESIKKRLSA